jgi:hypothetical protein
MRVKDIKRLLKAAYREHYGPSWWTDPKVKEQYLTELDEMKEDVKKDPSMYSDRPMPEITPEEELKEIYRKHYGARWFQNEQAFAMYKKDKQKLKRLKKLR